MKNPTIWESASRPLFVRTVWLEGSELRRGLQRHFLLDYDIRRPLERLHSAINNTQPKRPDELKRSISLELNDFTDFDDFMPNGEEVFLIGSAKVKLHEPFKLNTNKKAKTLKYHRRSSLFNRKYPNCNGYQFDNSKDISEIYLRRNSLSQPQQAIETADELLAERVLHWLDLAGKEDFLSNLNELKEMEVKLSKASKLRQDSIKRYNSKGQNTQKLKNHKAKNYQRATTAAAQQTTVQRNNKALEPVKHITIIFNKDGQPIRLHRPAKNIDLCALSSSPSTTRRLAGTLASARLYKSCENPRCLNVSKTPKTAGGANKSLSARRRLDTVADLTNSTLQKRLHENPMQSNYKNLHDAKKQLHIFMPTLPKKGLLAKSVYGTEDGITFCYENKWNINPWRLNETHI